MLSEIPWATDEEFMEHFRRTTITPIPAALREEMRYRRASSVQFGGLKSATTVYMLTVPHPDPERARTGWRVDSGGREWYSSCWIGQGSENPENFKVVGHVCRIHTIRDGRPVCAYCGAEMEL